MKIMRRGTRWAAAVLADTLFSSSGRGQSPSLCAAPIVSRLKTPEPALPK